MEISCPNCNAIWSMEEIDEQYCGACGYPDPDEDDLDMGDLGWPYDGSDDGER